MKVKKLLSLLAAATMTVTAFTGAMSVSAETATGTCGDLSWTLDSNGVLTFKGNGDMDSPNVEGKNYKDPETKNDYLDTYSYKAHKDDIKEVKIEEGATSIGFCAFYKLPKLEMVTLPSTITEFKGIKIQFVNSESGHPSEDSDGFQTISYSFAECPLLKNLTLTEGIKNIGAYAFNGCASLDNVTIPKSLVKWGSYSFSDCSSLNNVTLNDGLTTIGSYVFSNSALQSIVIPSSITNWVSSRTDYDTFKGNANCAFENCEELSSVTFEEGLEQIGTVSFANCSSLKRIVIPKSVTVMSNAFQNCIGLQEAYLEEGINIISSGGSNNSYFQSSFANCNNLKRLEIYAGIELNYTNALWCSGCSSLESLYLHDENITKYIPEANSTVKYYCYPGSATEKQMINQTKSNSRVLDITTEISKASEEVKTAVAEAEKYSEKDYTAESYGKLKALLDKAEKFDDDSGVLEMEFTADDISEAIKGLEKKPVDTPVNTPSNSQQQTPNKTTPQTPTTARPTKSTRSAAQVKKDKSAAKKAMKQAKITKLTAKSKAKKKIAVSWKKVKNAKGYQVQVSAKKNFKKVIYNKSLIKNKLTIKSSKIKSKKTYYVRVRAYATYKDANNATKKIYSKWVKKIRKVKAK